MVSQRDIDLVVQQLAGDLVVAEFNAIRFREIAKQDGEDETRAKAADWEAKHEQGLRMFLRLYPALCPNPKKSYLKAIDRYAHQLQSTHPEEGWFQDICEAMREGTAEKRNSWEEAAAQNRNATLG